MKTFETCSNYIRTIGIFTPQKTIKISNMIKKTIELFGDRFDFSESIIYDVHKTPLKIICSEHGYFNQTLTRLSKGYGCLKCSAKESARKRNLRSFNFNTLLNKNIQVLEESNNLIPKDVVTCKCTIHNFIFKEKIHKLFHLKFPCPKCREYSTSSEKIISDFKIIHKDRYDYSLVNYISTSEKVSIICRDHDIFRMLAQNHKNGQNCPICSNIKVGRDNSQKLKGSKQSEEVNRKRSLAMKKKIEDGSWTPCVTNSWAKSRCVVDDIPFRSTWEAIFYIITKNKNFEKLRIPYKFKDKSHIYITDFVDFNTKTIFEIKPDIKILDERVLAKEMFAAQWCKCNGFNFKYITEKWFKTNIQDINLDGYSINEKDRNKINKTINNWKVNK